MLVEIILLLIVLALLKHYFSKPAYMPPGSFGLPVFGELPSRNMAITRHFARLRDKYGAIFTTKWGSHPVVVLTDSALAKKAFNHPDLQGRPDFFTFNLFYFFKNLGLINSDGPEWTQNRRFVLRHLRDLGMGKTTLELSIQDEAAMLVNHLLETCLDRPAVMDVFINAAVVNVIWQMLASRRYDINDKEMLDYNRALEENIEVVQGPLVILDVLPFLHRVLPTWLLNSLMRLDVVCRNRDHTYAMFKRVIREHLASLDPDNPRDVIDQFLLHNRDRDDSGYVTHDDELSLLCIMEDMFMAGSETTSSSLRWMILYMALYPEVQAKCHALLDEVVPHSRLPSLHDRNQLAYLEAMLLDVLRLSSLLPLSLPHRATADVAFEGYVIPKDTLVLICTEMCHHDPETWAAPNQLHPEHFLDSSGKLDSKQENFLPFSTGRHQCLGESLARMELFLFGSAILQRFSIAPPEGVTLTAQTDPSQVLMNLPKRYEVVLKKRF